MVLLGKDKDFFCFFIIFPAFFQIIMGKRLSLQLVIRLTACWPKMNNHYDERYLCTDMLFGNNDDRSNL